jgi:hypothetical protein
MADKPNNLPALRDQDPKTILARYLSDESTKDIAASYGVTRQALSKHLLLHAEQEWKDAQVSRAIARKESAEDDLDEIRAKIATADREERERLSLTVVLARERLKSAQWELERVSKRIYGTDSPHAAQAVQININLRRDHTAVHTSTDQPVIDIEESKT